MAAGTQFQLYLAARQHREYWTTVYNHYAKLNRSPALIQQLKKVVDDLTKLEQMG